MIPLIRPAVPQDTKKIADILREAAQWLEQRGKPMWQDNEVASTRLSADVEAGLFFIAECDTEAAAVVKFEVEDKQFWPDVKQGESAFVHRLAVRRQFAGGRVSTALLNWAVDRARSLEKKYVRLDCAADRPKLRAVYEKFGFVHHSDRQAGPYLVSRYEYRIFPRP